MIFSVTILGSGAAVPTSQRYPTAQALHVGERIYLIDCAEGTQMQLRHYKIKLQQIRAIFISHLHGDHVFGLPGLLSSFSLLERSEPLDIFGPPQMEDWLSEHLKYFTPLGFPLYFHGLTAQKPEMIHEDKRMTVTCFPLKHRIPTWGYLFREKEKLISNAQLTHPSVKSRSYAYCSDTVYMEDLSGMIRDVDLLYHEATYGNDEKSRSKETFHSTAEDAARVALAANAGKLIIGHFSSRYKDITPLLNEARSIFPNTEAAEDGAGFDVEKTNHEHI